jgi:hypothetical protein
MCNGHGERRLTDEIPICNKPRSFLKRSIFRVRAFCEACDSRAHGLLPLPTRSLPLPHTYEKGFHSQGIMHVLEIQRGEAR